MKQEIKKVFFKRGLLAALLLFTVCQVILSIRAASAHVIASSVMRNEISQYIQEISGRLTPEKEAYIQSVKSRYDDAQTAVNTAYIALMAGQISQNEFESVTDESNGILQDRDSFDYVYNMVMYCKDAPDQRYILYAEGWRYLLDSAAVGYFPVFCVMLAVVALFSYDYDSGIYTLVTTSSKGRLNLYLKKAALTVILSIVITVLFTAVNIGAAIAQYGLQNGDFPVQSLENYNACPFRLSLAEALAAVTAIRVLGIMLFAAVAALFAGYFQNTLVTFAVSMSLILVPQAFFTDSSVYYNLPIPTPLMSGVPYLTGSAVIPPLIPYLLTVAVLMMVCWIAAAWLYTKNIRLRKGRTR